MSVRRIHDAPLRARNTFGVDARAGLLLEVDATADLPALLAEGVLRDTAGEPPLVLGGGSNLLIVRGPAVALHLACRGIAVLDAACGIVRADAGLGWHDCVRWTLAQGFAGLENLALIPGTVGAAPIQNIGAYGVEVGERVHAVEVLERATGRVARLDRRACGFAYRDSAFKREPDRWLVTAVEFALTPGLAAAPLALDYAGIRDELAAMAVHAPHAGDVAEAVTRLRRRKLPDPAVLGNAGSFFKNPIVPRAEADALLAAHPSLPVFRGDNEGTRKLSAAWLIDACGWKGHRDAPATPGDGSAATGDAGVSDRHALVLVNHGAATGAELLALARRIAADVRARLGVAIEPEPRIVGAAW